MASKAICILAGVCAPMFGAAAMASVSYSYESGAPTYDVSSGSATVPVYLQETLNGGSTSLITAEDGMSGVGLRVSLTGGGGVILMGFAPAAGWNGPESSSVSNTVASALLSTTSVDSGPSIGAAGQVLIGDLTLALGGTGTAPATFTLQRYSSLDGNTLTATNGYDLDFNSTSPAYNGAVGTTTFIATVPEPAILSLMGLSGALLLRRKRMA